MCGAYTYEWVKWKSINEILGLSPIITITIGEGNDQFIMRPINDVRF